MNERRMFRWYEVVNSYWELPLSPGWVPGAGIAGVGVLALQFVLQISVGGKHELKPRRKTMKATSQQIANTVLFWGWALGTAVIVGNLG